MGHEGEGSILSLLKKKGYAISLSSGYFTGSVGFAFFTIDVEVTDLGLDKYEEVITIVFEYIQMMRKSGVHEWIYKEVIILNTIVRGS